MTLSIIETLQDACRQEQNITKIQKSLITHGNYWLLEDEKKVTVPTRMCKMMHTVCQRLCMALSF